MFKELLAKRDSILDVFRKAAADLEAINTEINTRVEENTKAIAELNQENTDLNGLKSQNTTSIKNLNKILGK